MNPVIRGHFRVENWKLISKANASRLVVRGTQDISQNVRGYGLGPDYRERWVAMLEPRGYIWREVTHGMGINGHHRTLRDLVRNTAILGYEIELLPEPISQEVLASIEQHVAKMESGESYRPLRRGAVSATQVGAA